MGQIMAASSLQRAAAPAAFLAATALACVILYSGSSIQPNYYVGSAAVASARSAVRFQQANLGNMIQRGMSAGSSPACSRPSLRMYAAGVEAAPATDSTAVTGPV